MTIQDASDPDPTLPSVVDVAKRIIALAEKQPDGIEARVFPKTLAELCGLLIEGGVTQDTADETLHIKLLRLRTLYQRFFLIDQYPANVNLQNLRMIEFRDEKIVVPSYRRAIQHFSW